MTPSLGLTNLLEQLTELRATLCYPVYYWRWSRIQLNSQMKRGLEGSQAQELPVELGPLPVRTPPLTNLEVLHTPCFSNFMEASPQRHCCCCCSVTKSYRTLCDPMDCSTPGSSVLHSLLEFAQVHVHWVGDRIINSIFSHSLFSQSSSRILTQSWIIRTKDTPLSLSLFSR